MTATKILKRCPKKLWSVKSSDRAFTLIELLVVMPHCDTDRVAAVGVGAFQTYNLLICSK